MFAFGVGLGDETPTRIELPVGISSKYLKGGLSCALDETPAHSSVNAISAHFSANILSPQE
jgi:hypothetical protein